MDLKRTFLSIMVWGVMALVNMPQIAWAQTLEDKAKPWAFWPWGNGGVSKASIHADLVNMKNIGLGGTLLVPVHRMDERQDKKDEEWVFSPKFWKMVDYSFQLADSLGLGIGVSCPDEFLTACSSTILPEEAMQHVVWTDSLIHGSKILGLQLLRPQSYKDGKFQPVGSEGGYYEDIAAFAIPCQENVDKRDAAKQKGVGTSALSEVVGLDDVVRLSLENGKVVAATQNGNELKKIPKGTWRLLRMGHTVMVRSNNETIENGNGLEEDQFSLVSAQKRFASWYEKFLERPYSDVIKYLQIDSKENNDQNWGYRFAEEFKARRGYDLIPYLPVVAEVRLQSTEKYEQVRKDIRKTIRELVGEKYMKPLVAMAKEYDLEVSDDGVEIIDVVNLAPEKMKQKVDHCFTLGVNKILFRLPNHQTWSKAKGDMVAYVDNCQRWLQQGNEVVDIAVLLDEDSLSFASQPHRKTMPVPSGYKYDFINTETLLRWNPEASYKVGKPERQDFRILVVPQLQLSEEVKKKVEQLREAGIIVVDNLGKTRDFSENGISPDVEMPENLDYTHRRVLEPQARKDIYFLVNQEGKERTVTVTFRTQNVAIRQVVKLSLPAYGSVFVVMTDKDGMKIFNPLVGE